MFPILSEIKDSLPDSSQPWSFYTYSFIWDETAPVGECRRYSDICQTVLFKILILRSDHPKGNSYSQNAKETMLMNHDSWFVTHDSSKTSLFTDTTEGRKNCFLSVSFFSRLIHLYLEVLCGVRYHFCFFFTTCRSPEPQALKWCHYFHSVLIFYMNIIFIVSLLFTLLVFYFFNLYLVMWHLSRRAIWLTDCL